MINTTSTFYLGLEVTESNRYLDVYESATEFNLSLTLGYYTPTDLASHINDVLNEGLAGTYTVTFNRSAKTMTIARSTGTFSLLAASGANVDSSIYQDIGFGTSDLTASGTYTGSSFVTQYTPQFKLQDYTSHEDNQSLRESTVSKSASGLVSTVFFGVDKTFEFSIKFITDVYQSSGSPITNNSSGVANARTFLEYCIHKGELEFIPDSSSVSSYYKVLLETTEESGSGTAFKLKEQYGRGLVGYYETGLLRFRYVN